MLAPVIEPIDEPRMVIRVADDDLDIPSEKIDTIITRRAACKVVLLAEPSVLRVIAGSMGRWRGGGTAPACGATSTWRSPAAAGRSHDIPR